MKEIKKLKTTVNDVLKIIFEDQVMNPRDYNDTFTYDSMEEIESDTGIHVTCKDGEIWTNDTGENVYYQLNSEPGDLMRHFIYFDPDTSDYEYTDSDEMIGDICGY